MPPRVVPGWCMNARATQRQPVCLPEPPDRERTPRAIIVCPISLNRPSIQFLFITYTTHPAASHHVVHHGGIHPHRWHVPHRLRQQSLVSIATRTPGAGPRRASPRPRVLKLTTDRTKYQDKLCVENCDGSGPRIDFEQPVYQTLKCVSPHPHESSACPETGALQGCPPRAAAVTATAPVVGLPHAARPWATS